MRHAVQTSWSTLSMTNVLGTVALFVPPASFVRGLAFTRWMKNQTVLADPQLLRSGEHAVSGPLFVATTYPDTLLRCPSPQRVPAGARRPR
jgi:hypothetical protein